MGKVVIEKLLRSCDGIENIYILMRPKRGRSIEDRFEYYLKDQVFDCVRSQNPELLYKLKYVAGDVTEPNLGIDAENYEMLKENTNIILHLAASIKFNDPLEDALNMNSLGTQRCLELASDISHLKVNRKSNTRLNQEMAQIQYFFFLILNFISRVLFTCLLHIQIHT